MPNMPLQQSVMPMMQPMVQPNMVNLMGQQLMGSPGSGVSGFQLAQMNNMQNQQQQQQQQLMQPMQQDPFGMRNDQGNMGFQN